MGASVEEESSVSGEIEPNPSRLSRNSYLLSCNSCLQRVLLIARSHRGCVGAHPAVQSRLGHGDSGVGEHITKDRARNPTRFQRADDACNEFPQVGRQLGRRVLGLPEHVGLSFNRKILSFFQLFVKLTDNWHSIQFHPKRWIQRSFNELGRHYRTTILPARPLSPRDKAKVEVAVQIAQRWSWPRFAIKSSTRWRAQCAYSRARGGAQR